MKSVIKKVVKKAKHCWGLVLMFPAWLAVAADGTINLPSANEGFLDKIVKWFQDIINFIGGAGALFMAFIAGCAAILLWIFAPKAGAAMGFIMRVCVGAIALFNLGLFIAWLQA
ncbi:hypothetical protein WMR86_20180 (plasmid) [Proteus vulgaris]|uniref:hypothetical protein n=1 Tax=Morganellaceae TaxID=1903414 RepID=UPI00155E8E14|nr:MULTISPECIES: hypothetical protein [Morganellaceae]ELT0455834.1 hypothetical protein [Morganella morganii]MCS6741728.1 hypothetical protein [Acinetobacter baumannii]EKW7428850.1 hypothetical protein [Proteus mirabilis]MBQ0619613.1 hypothetical protein [Proteus mirabilis]MBS3881207.1 hypothetical protein [Proteus mirabilis]